MMSFSTSSSEWSSIDIAVRDAVDRSAGLCEAFSGPWDEESLLYLAERSPSLKSLHISHDEYASYEVLIDIIKKLPLLEDLDISPPFCHICESEKFFDFSDVALTALLDNCPLLDSLNISGSLDITMDAQLRAKCARVENLILPYVSDEEYVEEEDEEPEEDEDG
ncbi:hypothetical protein HU200_005075 [Digitaria exilis]|uniref:Uncharacterized protein n=1 Tax=Digitaria exilis TaxID=1010633 RepID=A0A835KUK0_9POAL|nr:hypothetical protein HU200_005075 [Digitaria exilis]